MKKFTLLNLLMLSALGLTGCGNTSNVSCIQDDNISVVNGDTIEHGISINRLASGTDNDGYDYQVISYTLVPNFTDTGRVGVTLTMEDSSFTVSNYLTYTLDEVNHQITITCKQAFSSLATLTIASLNDPSIYASLTIHYSAKLYSTPTGSRYMTGSDTCTFIEAMTFASGYVNRFNQSGSIWNVTISDNTEGETIPSVATSGTQAAYFQYSTNQSATLPSVRDVANALTYSYSIDKNYFAAVLNAWISDSTQDFNVELFETIGEDYSQYASGVDELTKNCYFTLDMSVYADYLTTALGKLYHNNSSTSRFATIVDWDVSISFLLNFDNNVSSVTLESSSITF